MNINQEILKNLKKTNSFNIFNLNDHSSLNQFFGEDDDCKTEVFIKDQSLEQLFKESISDDKENHFCKRDIGYIKGNDDEMNTCKFCNRIVCPACMEICHKDCKMHRTQDLFCNQVKIYYRLCECKHTQKESEETLINYSKLDIMKKFNLKNNKFPCFLSEKLNDIYHCKKKDFKKYLDFKNESIDKHDNNNNIINGVKDIDDDLPAYGDFRLLKKNTEKIKFNKIFKDRVPKFRYLKNTNRIVCQYCFINCEPARMCDQFDAGNYFDVDENLKIINPSCDCNHEAMSTHDDINLIIKFICYIFNSADDSRIFKIDEVMEKMEIYLKEFYGDLNENEQGRKLVAYMLDTIKILSIMYKRNLVYDKIIEFKFMKSFYEKIGMINENQIYLTYDRINLSLTYILYFYRKNIFQHVFLMDNIIMNCSSRISRMNIHRENSNLLEKMKKNFNDYEDLFEIKTIIKIFKIIDDISCFSVNLDFLPENKNYPFVLYFFLMLVKSYCFSNEDIISIKDFVLSTKLKFDRDNSYNNLVKKLIDEILYITQVFVIDNYLINLKDEEIENIDLKDQLFFYEDNFKNYFKIICDEYYQRSKDIYFIEDEENLVSNTKKNVLMYFDVFNNNFIPLIVLNKGVQDEKVKSFLNNYYKRNTVYFDVKLKKKYEDDDDDKLKNAIGYFDVFVIPYHSQEINITDTKEKIKQLENNSCQFLLRCIKRILNFHQIDLDKIINSFAFNEGEFLEYALSSLKRINILKKKKLILNKYIDEDIEIDIRNMDMRIHRVDLLYLFYMIFIEELYRSPQFKIVSFHFNFLIFLFLGSIKNVEFLLKEVKFFQFLFSKKIDQNNIKKSYLIKSLYNSSESQRNNNFIWSYFYYIFSKFIDREDTKENLSYLKDIILYNYINEIIKFYEILHIKRKNLMKSLNQTNENNLINKMNFNFICHFLIIAKNILITKDPKDFSPFNYNVNKFETIEKLLIIADIAFSVNFKVKGYLKSYVEFMNYKNDSNIHYEASNNFKNVRPQNDYDKRSGESNGTNKNEIELINKENIPLMTNEKKGIPNFQLLQLKDIKLNVDNDQNDGDEDFKFIPFKKLNKHNVQYLIMDILSSQTSIPTISTYFNILNHNINEFIIFLSNRDKIYESFKENKNCYRQILFNLEKLIIRFLLNFFIIKVFNQKYNGFIDMSFKKKEMKNLINNPIFKSTLDEGDHDINTRFLVNKMKIKIMDVLKEYFKSRTYLEEELDLKHLIFVNMFWIFKQNYINRIHNDQENAIYQENFKEFFKIYIKYANFARHVSINQRDSLNLLTQDKDLEEILHYLSSIRINVTSDDNSRNYNLKFFDFKKSTGDYFKLFIQYENKSNNLFNIIIEKLITDERIREDQEGGFGKRKSNTKVEKAIKHLFKLDIISDKEKRNNLIIRKVWNNFWKKIYDDLNENNDTNKISLLIQYIFDKLTETVDNHVKIYSYQFDYIFNENFLEILNFLNQILYQNPWLLRSIISEKLNNKDMTTLLKFTLKLNDYIIGISESETNMKVFSLSIIYFTMMDFFLFISEGIFDGQIILYYFESLDNKIKYNGVEIIKKINELFLKEKELHTIEQIAEFLEVDDENKIIKIVENLMDKNGIKETEKLKKIKQIIRENSDKDIDIEQKNLLKKKAFERKISAIYNKNLPKKLEVQIEEEIILPIGLNIFDNFTNLNRYDVEETKKDQQLIETLNDSTTVDNLIDYSGALFHENENEKEKENEYNNKIKSVMNIILDLSKEFKFVRESNLNIDLGKKDDIFMDKNKNIMKLFINDYKNKFLLMQNIINIIEKRSFFIYKYCDINYNNNINKNLKFEEWHEKFENNIGKLDGTINIGLDEIDENDDNEEIEMDKIKNINTIDGLRKLFVEFFKYLEIILKDFEEILEKLRHIIGSIKINENQKQYYDFDLNNLKEKKEDFSLFDFAEFLRIFKEKCEDYSQSLELFFNQISEDKIDKFKQLEDKLDTILGHTKNFLKSLNKRNSLNIDDIYRKSSSLELKDIKQIIRIQEKTIESMFEVDIPEEENNFFYQNFKQLSVILSLLTKSKIKNFYSGSERLMIQFLYISRAIKEFTECDYKNMDNKVAKIVKYSFTKLFDIEYIFTITDLYKDNMYCMPIITQLLKILIAFLEEFPYKNDEEYLKFKELLDIRCSQKHELYLEMILCFKRHFEKDPQIIFNDEFIKNQLFIQYAENDTIYVSDEIRLAGLYNYLLNILTRTKLSLHEKFNEFTLTIKDIPMIDVFEVDKNHNNNNNQIICEKIPQLKKVGITHIGLKEFYTFYQEISCQVEVEFLYDKDDKDLENRYIFFLKHPRAFNYLKSLKKVFVDNVDRSNLGSKIDGFIKYYDRFLFSIDMCFFYKKKPSFIIKLLSLFYKNRVEMYTSFEYKYFNYINFFLNLILNILLLSYFYVDVPYGAVDALKSQLVIFTPHKDELNPENFDRLNLLTTRYQYVFYTTIPIVCVQAIIYLVWIFFRFHLTFWLTYYDSDNRNYYIIKKKVKPHDFEETDMHEDKIISFDQNERKKSKIYNLFAFSSKNFSCLKFLLILFKTLFLSPEIFFIIWGIVSNILYIASNYPLFIVIQISSIYNFSPFIRLFAKVLKDKSISFLTLLVMTFLFEYLFMWVGFLHGQEFLFSQFRLMKSGYEFEDDVKKLFFNYILIK